MNIVLIGPQGSGKGTQARLLCDKFKFSYFEAGAFLREIAKTNEGVRRMLAEGKLVPDEEMSSYVISFLDEKGLYDGTLFDGFPRTLKQYKVFKSWLAVRSVKLGLAILLVISEEETIRRLSARRMDPVTGKIYNLITDKPPVGLDEDKLIQREDDKPEAIKKRLTLYRVQTEPLITELKRETDVVEIDGERSIEAIFKDLTSVIEERMNK